MRALTYLILAITTIVILTSCKLPAEAGDANVTIMRVGEIVTIGEYQLRFAGLYSSEGHYHHVVTIKYPDHTGWGIRDTYLRSGSASEYLVFGDHRLKIRNVTSFKFEYEILE